MILTIAEDFTNTTVLDSELTSVPTSGMYLNSGVHSSITVNNLLQFLPKVTFTFTAYAGGTTYGKYTDSRVATDIVDDGSGNLYQSLLAANVGNLLTDTTYWLPTNIESIRIKSFVLRSQDAAISKIGLTRRLVDSQYLYNVAEVSENPTAQLLPNDYAAWVFEPRGSDYVTFRINQIALQATTASSQSLYVINQGQLVTTLTLNPNLEGRLVFEEIDYTFSGKGKWVFAIDSQVVLTNGSFIDPLKNDGFVTYTATGIGATPQAAEYSFGNSNNGLNFNITAYFDGTVYVNNNLVEYGNYLQAAWSLDVLNLFLSNSNSRSNRDERNVMDREMLRIETKVLDVDSVARRFDLAMKGARKAIAKTFDRELRDDNEGLEIEVSSI